MSLGADVREVADGRVTIRSFSDQESMIRALSTAVAARLEQAIAERGRASFVASGGSTPGPLYDRLRESDLDWSKLWVTLSDERWVPQDHADSNAGMLSQRLLTGAANTAELVSLYTGAPTAAEGAAAAEARLAEIPRPFDVMLLGMGEDGHTASLFPGTDGLEEALAPDGKASVRAFTLPATGAQRMSMTLSALCDSREILLLIAGAAKRRVLDAALAEGPVTAMPVRAVLRQDRTPVAVYWAP